MELQRNADAKSRDPFSAWDELPRVQAVLNYAPDVGGEEVDQKVGEQQFNGARSETMPIYNARPLEKTLSLEREGFALSEISVPAGGYVDDDAYERSWTPAVKEKLRQATGASHVVTWGRLVRYSPRSPESKRTRCPERFQTSIAISVRTSSATASITPMRKRR